MDVSMMTDRRILTALALPAALLVAGCENEGEVAKPADQAPAAASEILGGSISDDMIDYETLQSRAPTIAEEPEPDQDEAETSEAEE